MALLSSPSASASQEGVWQAKALELEELVDLLQLREREQERKMRAWHTAIKAQIDETSRLLGAQEAEAATREAGLSTALAAARADAEASRRELAATEADVLGLQQALDSLRVRQQEQDMAVEAREQEAGEVLRQAKEQVETLAAALEAARAADEEKGQRLAVAEARLGRTEAALAEARRENDRLRTAHAALLHEAEGLRAVAGKAREYEGRLAAMEGELARERAHKAARAALMRERGLLEEALCKEADRIARCVKAVGRAGGSSLRHGNPAPVGSSREDDGGESGTEPDDAEADPVVEQSLSIIASTACH